MNRRGFLTGLSAVLAVAAVTKPNLLGESELNQESLNPDIVELQERFHIESYENAQKLYNRIEFEKKTYLTLAAATGAMTPAAFEAVTKLKQIFDKDAVSIGGIAKSFTGGTLGTGICKIPAPHSPLTNVEMLTNEYGMTQENAAKFSRDYTEHLNMTKQMFIIGASAAAVTEYFRRPINWKAPPPQIKALRLHLWSSRFVLMIILKAHGLVCFRALLPVLLNTHE